MGGIEINIMIAVCTFMCVCMHVVFVYACVCMCSSGYAFLEYSFALGQLGTFGILICT